MEDEHDKLHYEGGRGSLRLHVSPLEAGLLPTPNFHERVPRLCDSCFSDYVIIFFPSEFICVRVGTINYHHRSLLKSALEN